MAITKTPKTPKVALKKVTPSTSSPSTSSPSTSSGSATGSTTKKASKGASDTRTLRSEVYTLKMKLALRELKETHKIKKARHALARHLTQLHNS